MTELEYRQARDLNKPCLFYLKSENALVRACDFEPSPEAQQQLKALKEELQRNHIISSHRHIVQTANDRAFRFIGNHTLRKLRLVATLGWHPDQRADAPRLASQQPVGMLENELVIMPVAGHLFIKNGRSRQNLKGEYP